MQLNSDIWSRVKFLVGTVDTAVKLPDIQAKIPFDHTVIAFLNDVSRLLMGSREAKSFPDVITFGFWLRRGSVLKRKQHFQVNDGNIQLGRGVVFHIAPSNVAVNFAYSLVSGLLTGNANIVRVPSKDFPQVQIITEAFNRVLDQYEELKPYVLCVRYGRDKEINDCFSLLADMRVVWGGDRTIAELRTSPLLPRSGEVTFADRISFAMIDSAYYLEMEDKARVAEDFYNDTFLSDQNACTSPRVVVWTGNRINEAKDLFWKLEHELVESKYMFQPIQCVHKLTQSYLIAARESGVKVEERKDNLIYRVNIPKITDYLMDYRGDSGYFYEYDCDDMRKLLPLMNDKRCQTVSYLGDNNILAPLIAKGVKGVDRVVRMGKTMDFDLVWDGYSLPAVLTRTVVMA